MTWLELLNVMAKIGFVAVAVMFIALVLGILVVAAVRAVREK